MIMEQRHLQMVHDILKKYPYNFFAFGSRVYGTPRKLSDLDICFFEKIPLHIQSNIEEDFEQSDLPFTVDLIDWEMTENSFKETIKHNLFCIQQTNAYSLLLEKYPFLSLKKEVL
jgi:hypothetical protein